MNPALGVQGSVACQAEHRGHLGPTWAGSRGFLPAVCTKCPFYTSRIWGFWDAPWAGVGTSVSKADVSTEGACLCYCVAQLALLTQGIFL